MIHSMTGCNCDVSAEYLLPLIFAVGNAEKNLHHLIEVFKVVYSKVATSTKPLVGDRSYKPGFNKTFQAQTQLNRYFGRLYVKLYELRLKIVHHIYGSVRQNSMFF